MVLFNQWLGENKRVQIFLKGICSKVNIKARLEFEFTDYDIAVQHVSRYTTGTPS